MRQMIPLALALLTAAELRAGSIYRVTERSAEQIRALDRARTVVILPGGILEEHGPYLPTFTDGYWNEHATMALARALAGEGKTVLVFPTIPLGNSGANDIGAKFSYPGTFAVSFRTLRAVFMDLASELGEQGFRPVFVVHLHGAPNHQRALDQASDYFTETYGGTMVNLTGLLPVLGALEGKKTERERREDGLVIHAGMDETSMVLALQPKLVAPSYRQAKPFSGKTMEELVALAGRDGWPGYFGSPRLARADRYESGWGHAEDLVVSYALEILRGTDPKTIPRFGDEMLKSAPDVELDRASLEHERQIAERQSAWLRAHSLQ